MDYTLYKFLHIGGVLGLFLALGVLATSDCKSCRKGATILHGIGLLVIFVAGFGMIAKLGIGFPWWIIVKIVIWLALGAMLAVAKRQLLPRPAMMGLIFALGLTAVGLVLFGKSASPASAPAEEVPGVAIVAE